MQLNQPYYTNLRDISINYSQYWQRANEEGSETNLICIIRQPGMSWPTGHLTVLLSGSTYFI